MFNGTYTITNKITGEWRTFRIRTQAADATFAPGKRVVDLLVGPDNESAYRGFGFVEEDQIRIWKRHAGDSAYTHFVRMLDKAGEALAFCAGFGGEVEGAGADFTYADKLYHVEASKRCARCNRKLTTPDSLARGVGPECADRMGM